MANQWVNEPHHLPRKCALTGNSMQEAGPYLETDFRYFDADPNAAARGDLRLNTLYISKQFLDFALVMDGSPYANLSASEAQSLIDTLAQKEAEIAALQDRVAELEAGAPVTLSRDELRLALAVDDLGAEPSLSPASSSTDPDHHEASAKRRTRKAAAA